MTDPTPNALSPEGKHAPGLEPLSPAAQKVADAAFVAYDDETSYIATGEQHAGRIAAAAIRTLADQVVPEQPAIPEGDLTEQTYRWDERSGIRAHILAIAGELEGQ